MSAQEATEAAYDAACEVLGRYVDDNGELRGLTAYQAAVRAVDAAAPHLGQR